MAQPGTGVVRDRNISGGYVVHATSGNHDIVNLGSLRDESHAFVKEAARSLAPFH